MHTNLQQSKLKRLLELLLVSTRLGLTSFGGPTAHLGYFHEEYVRKRQWIDEKSYADLVALCQFLPGPASSQVGIGIGVMRAGIVGGIVSFIGFTWPSVLALILFALLLQGANVGDMSWLHGLKIVAVVIVAHAILGMAKNLTPDIQRKTIALVALVAALLVETIFTQVVIIVIAGVLGAVIYKEQVTINEPVRKPFISKTIGFISLGLFFGLLLILPLLSSLTAHHWIVMMDSFYRAGSLVFGGGHVVLPLLENEFVSSGLMDETAFIAGYGATQAVPGPLFTFAAYIGTVIDGWQGGLFATFAIFLPAFLLILGTLPFWHQLRSNSKMNGAFMGVNAAVVGILIAAFYNPIWTSAILQPIDFAMAAILFSLLVFWKLPPWVIVLAGAIGGWVISFM
ncbi:chromate efflux transporter [Solibacillus sp. FSL R7-0668]|uniref:chromate efflux transporter n=1 Tax=Solibacillus sp. FSL R7-0668 TaxID=2921688 RepID=UPI0030F9530D